MFVCFSARACVCVCVCVCVHAGQEGKENAPSVAPGVNPCVRPFHIVALSEAVAVRRQIEMLHIHMHVSCHENHKLHRVA